MQRGSTECGFWAAWLMLAASVGVGFDDPALIVFPIKNIYNRLLQLYDSFISDVEGVRRWVLDVAFEAISIDLGGRTANTLVCD